MQPSSAVLLTALLLLSGGDAFLFERAASSRSRLASAPPTTVRTRGAAADDDGFQLGPASVEAAVAALRRGECIVVTDDESRENEGDLIAAAETITAETVAFIVRHSSGVICGAADGERLDELQLGPMVVNNEDPKETAFTVTVDYKGGKHGAISTGISAADRAATLRALADPSATAADFNRPGHIFPLRARRGGAIVRDGHTEATVDFCKLAGLAPVGALCEIVKDDGTGDMARMPDLETFSEEHGLVLTTIADLIAYRKRTESLVDRLTVCEMPTRHGYYEAVAYRSRVPADGAADHVALVYGGVAALERAVAAHDAGDESAEAPLVRVHSECPTGDIFGSLRCDSGAQLNDALGRVAAEGAGVVVYLRGHEGRGAGIAEEFRAYALQDGGLDTVAANAELGLPVDTREYTAAAHILRDLGVGALRLLTNNPAKVRALSGAGEAGLRVVERVPSVAGHNAVNAEHLATKREKMGHLGVGDEGALRSR